LQCNMSCPLILRCSGSYGLVSILEVMFPKELIFSVIYPKNQGFGCFACCVFQVSSAFLAH